MGKAVGKLRTFIIEPFLPHEQKEEAYVCIYSHRGGDTILFTHEGGVDIGDVDAKALKLDLEIEDQLSVEQIKEKLLVHVESGPRKEWVEFFYGLGVRWVVDRGGQRSLRHGFPI